MQGKVGRDASTRLSVSRGRLPHPLPPAATPLPVTLFDSPASVICVPEDDSELRPHTTCTE
jgi:hypothetical protein